MYSATEPSSHFATYATAGALGADADLQADGQGPCRQIICGTAGTLILTKPGGGVVTIPAAVATAGAPLNVRATKIGAASTAQNILVLW